MKYTVGYNTNVGVKKLINQDSICIDRAMTLGGEIALCMICDGMGGLSQGEFASAKVVNAFDHWFKAELSRMECPYDMAQIKCRMDELLSEVNSTIYTYGINNSIQLGTTISALLILPNGNYIIAHIGDSRVYLFSGESTSQLTEDQTLVMREVKQGILTTEQAKKDSRRNVLLQCLGANRTVTPSFLFGESHPNDLFLLCSDGFIHEITEYEIAKGITETSVNSKEQISAILNNLIDLCISRGEKDNISAICVKCYNEGE